MKGLSESPAQSPLESSSAQTQLHSPPHPPRHQGGLHDHSSAKLDWTAVQRDHLSPGRLRALHLSLPIPPQAAPAPCPGRVWKGMRRKNRSSLCLLSHLKPAGAHNPCPYSPNLKVDHLRKAGVSA